jgi:hypothetical protein
MRDGPRWTRWKLARTFSRRRAEVVTFCDSCSQVCDRGCRSDATREQAQTRLLRMRPF